MTAKAEEAAAPSRHFSYVTGEYSIHLDYAGLTALMDAVFDVWDAMDGHLDEKASEGFQDLVDHLAELREYTGWGGVSAVDVGPNSKVVVNCTATLAPDNGPWGER